MYEAVTVSKNVCSRGIYFCLGGERVKIGTFIEIILTLPQEITHSGNRKVRCLGRVERYELKDLEGSDAGVAMSIEKYEFLHNN